MYYYKIEKNGVIDSFESRTTVSSDDSMTEITKDEYDELLDEFNKKLQELSEQIAAEESQIEQSKDERIAALEAENAALLYQVLTGAELTDV